MTDQWPIHSGGYSVGDAELQTHIQRSQLRVMGWRKKTFGTVFQPMKRNKNVV